jgi:glycosyltransferase involved in cell wall biosynthesis
MRLCHIVPSLEERHGGPSKSVHELASAFARAGHEIELLTTSPEGPSVQTEGSLSIRTFHRDWPQRLCRSAGLNGWLQRSRPEIIHHHSLWLRTLHYAHRASVRNREALVVSPRGMMSEWAWNHRRHRKALATRLVHTGALEAVTGWHATSEEEAADILERGFRQPVCVAPNGVAAPTPGEREAAAAHWREFFPALAERPVALFFSRFHQKKRVLELIDLWIEHGPADWILLLVGIPQDYTAETLEEYARRSAGGSRIAVFSGAGHPPPYAVASLFLLPSHNENFGLVIAEAMASGVPALVTDTTPWRSLEAEGAGWCVPWDRYPEALRAAVAEGPEKLRERGERASAWVLREYSWEKPRLALEAFYRRLIS